MPSQWDKENFKKQLEGLQDAATPKDFLQIHSFLLSHYAVPLSDIFTKIEETPIAVASIGQVHKAWLLDGTPVVLKIQHEHIESIAEIDLTIIRKLTYWIGRYFTLDGLDYAYKQIEALILQEIDFEKEANSLIFISSSLSDENSWSFPTVFESLSGVGGRIDGFTTRLPESHHKGLSAIWFWSRYFVCNY